MLQYFGSVVFWRGRGEVEPWSSGFFFFPCIWQTWAWGESISWSVPKSNGNCWVLFFSENRRCAFDRWLPNSVHEAKRYQGMVWLEVVGDAEILAQVGIPPQGRSLPTGLERTALGKPEGKHFLSCPFTNPARGTGQNSLWLFHLNLPVLNTTALFFSCVLITERRIEMILWSLRKRYRNSVY